MTGIGEYPERWHYCEWCRTNYTDSDGGCECVFCTKCGDRHSDEELDENYMCKTCVKDKEEEKDDEESRTNS